MAASPTAPIFDVQRFSIHDGPGIRTLVFFKGCNLHCDWCQNPEAHDAQPTVAFYADRCCESFSCEEVCTEQAINRSGFRINADRCTVCGDCVDSCAYSALRLIGARLTPEELMDRVLLDKPYFDGGGVTLSGGEPTLYPKFLDQFVDLCVRSGIHVGIETAGRFSLEKCLPILQKIDLIYFDLKILDPLRHEQSVGKGLQTILSKSREERVPRGVSDANGPRLHRHRRKHRCSDRAPEINRPPEASPPRVPQHGGGQDRHRSGQATKARTQPLHRRELRRDHAQV
ncbi:MAG: glycyl-radical enzyme activating protein [Deltaproteobacteria bacterium]|nr:glycyl-radical enzyme activating protein [Deltaproteobacteria bacterium]